MRDWDRTALGDPPPAPLKALPGPCGYKHVGFLIRPNDQLLSAWLSKRPISRHNTRFVAHLRRADLLTGAQQVTESSCQRLLLPRNVVRWRSPGARWSAYARPITTKLRLLRI